VLVWPPQAAPKIENMKAIATDRRPRFFIFDAPPHVIRFFEQVWGECIKQTVG
jgi:hypothetical protein